MLGSPLFRDKPNMALPEKLIRIDIHIWGSAGSLQNGTLIMNQPGACLSLLGRFLPKSVLSLSGEKWLVKNV